MDYSKPTRTIILEPLWISAREVQACVKMCIITPDGAYFEVLVADSSRSRDDYDKEKAYTRLQRKHQTIKRKGGFLCTGGNTIEGIRFVIEHSWNYVNLLGVEQIEVRGAEVLCQLVMWTVPRTQYRLLAAANQHVLAGMNLNTEPV